VRPDWEYPRLECADVRRRLNATALDRNEVGAMLVAAGLGHPREHALISLPAINGLRISEALNADIDKLGVERGHRNLTITRKGT
jgi:integrase/recombinase XerD